MPQVVIVGAGPGGLMAAEAAAGAGRRVTVYDQRRSPARKFVLAGRGGLNLTHTEPIEEFLDNYGPEREYLEEAIRGFGPDDLRAWADQLGEPTFVGSSGRVFPESFRAVPLLRAWLRRLRALGVSFEPGHRWVGWDRSGDRSAMRFVDGDGREHRVEYDAAVLALGGSSWPGVGSDGSWVEILRDAGVEVSTLRPANCGVTVSWSAPLVDRFAGEPVKNAAVIVDGEAVRGDPIVTATGLEGGPIYAHSRRLRERFDREQEASLTVDLLPDLEVGDVVRRLVERRQKKKSVSTWLGRCGLSPVGIGLMRESTGNDLPTDPDGLGELAKAVTLQIEGMAPIDRAISSAGGVSWSELDENFQLLGRPGTYVVGEMLDWEAPTGGYLLQGVFSTAHHVGSKGLPSGFSPPMRTNTPNESTREDSR